MTYEQKVGDRDKIMKMLTKVSDRFSLKIYKKAYNITDKEINTAKKK